MSSALIQLIVLVLVAVAVWRLVRRFFPQGD